MTSNVMGMGKWELGFITEYAHPIQLVGLRASCKLTHDVIKAPPPFNPIDLIFDFQQNERMEKRVDAMFARKEYTQTTAFRNWQHSWCRYDADADMDYAYLELKYHCYDRFVEKQYREMGYTDNEFDEMYVPSEY